MEAPVVDDNGSEKDDRTMQREESERRLFGRPCVPDDAAASAATPAQDDSEAHAVPAADDENEDHALSVVAAPGPEEATSAVTTQKGRRGKRAKTDDLQMELGFLNEKNVGQLRKLNLATFPVVYKDGFYADVVNHTKYSRLAYLKDVLVAGLCCRVETASSALPMPPDAAPAPNNHSNANGLTDDVPSSSLPNGPTPRVSSEGGGCRLYIMTLGVLKPYRRLGIGTRLLEWLLDEVHKANAETPAQRGHGVLDDIYLHVQSNNDVAIAFYQQYGFSVINRLEHYYTTLDPSDCYVLSKRLT
ncbi:unnamed protein product [Vitrella brassicaformis CCMP3155]|uniref:N-acetyltransferase domain-containing protein n=2 Tax=Vitrella brassicaformis TaxID=1169539 RepID=A0A0G4E9E2_VITBC|nr:unnamed protein product [Vitrella brassicaformis CCMP3155]|eukprot:CEL91849.1 unnamed protein product [Vitrella brassicaformis CCMP3155]